MGNGISTIVESPVARELAPAGPRSGPNPYAKVFQIVLGGGFWGCCAAQREQAPSPHGWVEIWGNCIGRGDWWWLLA